MGIWLTASDLAEMQQYCVDDPLGMGEENCSPTIGMISTAGVSYCDANCVAAVDGNGSSGQKFS